MNVQCSKSLTSEYIFSILATNDFNPLDELLVSKTQLIGSNDGECGEIIICFPDVLWLKLICWNQVWLPEVPLN
jgi:hypothetical protein